MRPVEGPDLLFPPEEHGNTYVLHGYFINVAFDKPIQRPNEFVNQRELFGFDCVELFDECHVVQFVGDGALLIDARHEPDVDVFDE